jgi:hypothetical protein
MAASQPSAARLHQFFRDYAAVSFGPDPEKLAAFYADGFLVAGPQGSAAFRNDEQFLAWLRQLHDFNQASGMTGMRVVSIEEQRLSALFTIATVEWGATFQKTGDDVITFKISYILQEEQDATFKVLGYLSHEDQMEAMRARGLL